MNGFTSNCFGEIDFWKSNPRWPKANTGWNSVKSFVWCQTPSIWMVYIITDCTEMKCVAYIMNILCLVVNSVDNVGNVKLSIYRTVINMNQRWNGRNFSNVKMVMLYFCFWPIERLRHFQWLREFVFHPLCGNIYVSTKVNGLSVPFMCP